MHGADCCTVPNTPTGLLPAKTAGSSPTPPFVVAVAVRAQAGGNHKHTNEGGREGRACVAADSGVELGHFQAEAPSVCRDESH
jgi:hypothetical protein